MESETVKPKSDDILTTMIEEYLRLTYRRCPECDKRLTPNDAYGHDCE